MWTTSMGTGNHGVVGGISECRRSSCPSWISFLKKVWEPFHAFFWNCGQIDVARPHCLQVNTGSGNNLLPVDTKSSFTCPRLAGSGVNPVLWKMQNLPTNRPLLMVGWSVSVLGVLSMINLLRSWNQLKKGQNEPIRVRILLRQNYKWTHDIRASVKLYI